ncbi:DUF3173 domain-containing protein [Dellaglioa algida]|uniref:DUF3173 family protein n=1 Tax=Dellaglioa algida TaxID=105612 RepID=UPI000716EBF2|nr:DUF3173 family protein [Dellaglioa algida]MDK1733317.1 DUF3173 domain-containing protein [Dellaglioa algida]MDK1734766.1 DUF3173 domain-containing protein [Dellaglioa algida]
MLSIGKEEIMEQTGYSPAVAGRIIRECKQKLVAEGYKFYANKRLSRVPLDTVNHMLGITLTGSEAIGNVQTSWKSMGV